MYKIISIKRRAYNALKVLIPSSPEWLNFFESIYRTPQDLLAAMPTDSRFSKSTIFNNYIKLHPELNNKRQWSNFINTLLLINKSSKWEVFFNTIFKTPKQLISSIPSLKDHTIITIMNYYCTYNQVDKARSWINVSNALTLMNTDEVWAIFFNREYKTPMVLIKAIPEGGPPAKASVMTYYFALHSDKRGGRLWVSTANAVDLAEKDNRWRVFLGTRFINPQAVIDAKPPGGPENISTLLLYYCCYNPEIKNKSNWINYGCARIFEKKNRAAVKSLITGSKSYKEVKSRYKLTQSIRTLQHYIHALRFFNSIAI